MNRYISWLIKSILLFILFHLYACQKLADDGAEEGSSSTNDVALKITTRSAQTAQIAYPVTLYAFTEDGEFVTKAKIKSDEQAMQLNLPKGKYCILAVSGGTDEYVFPESPSMQDVITMKNGNCAKNSLMLGRAEVTLSTKSTKVDVQLYYVVASVDIVLQNVPVNVDNIKLSISSLYASLSFDGEYTGKSGKLVVDCKEESEGVWVAGPLYIFPGSGAETNFSISLEDNDEVHTFGYIYKGIPKANHPFNVIGSYNGGLSVGGNLLPNNWEAPIDVNFDFGEENSAGGDAGDDGGDEDIDDSRIPSIGSIWMGCIVADVGEVDKNGVDLLLMSLEEWSGTISDADGLIESYSVNEIEGWRLPSEMEAKLIQSRFSGTDLDVLNDKIIDEDCLPIDGVERYLCYKGDIPYSFQFMKSGRVTKAGKEKIYLVRAVKTYHLSLSK